MKLIIAAPANGMELKNALQARLAADPRISSLRDMSTDTSYPQLSFAVAQAVAAGEAERAILICGTGIGTGIGARADTGAGTGVAVHADANGAGAHGGAPHISGRRGPTRLRACVHEDSAVSRWSLSWVSVTPELRSVR